MTTYFPHGYEMTDLFEQTDLILLTARYDKRRNSTRNIATSACHSTRISIVSLRLTFAHRTWLPQPTQRVRYITILRVPTAYEKSSGNTIRQSHKIPLPDELIIADHYGIMFPTHLD